MSGLDPQVAMHRLNINSDAKPVKQRACLVKGGSEELKKWESGISSLWNLEIG